MNRKKMLGVILSAMLLVFSVTACSNDQAKDSADTSTETPASETDTTEDATELTTASKEYTFSSSSTPETYDYVISARTSDHEVLANFVDGLLENDHYGHFVGALAETWESNDDATVWTFHLKPGTMWVTNTGEEYDEVKAEDFVTGLRHGVEFDSETAWLLQGVITGYSEYQESDFSDEAFANVGVKALDDYTVEYTLEQPTPYFDTMTTYTVLYPINRSFLESKGTGCVLGSPDREACDFGSLKNDSILYNGGYLLSENTAKSQIVYVKNDSYWDADNVYFEKVTTIYDEGQDPYSTIKGFENGTYSAAALNTSWSDYQDYVDQYEGYLSYSIPNNYCFGLVFNFNRQSFEETNYAQDETLRQNTHDAIMNLNFRKAMRAAYDAKASIMVTTPEELAEQMLRNVNNFPGAGTTSDGTPYFDLVEEAYAEMTGETVDLSDGQNPWVGKEAAMKYIEAAKADGIQFPIHLDILVAETSDRLTKQAQSMKKSVEDNTEGNIIIELVMRDLDTVQNIAYRNSDPAKSDYDISTFTGWGPDYVDPKSFVDTYSPKTGYYMVTLGLGTVNDDGTVADKEIKEHIGLMEYEELYQTADAITDDMDARYRAFAKADANMIKNLYFVPEQMQARSQRVTKVVPFSGIYADTGVANLKFKGMRLQEDMVTTEQYNEEFDKFQENR